MPLRAVEVEMGPHGASWAQECRASLSDQPGEAQPDQPGSHAGDLAGAGPSAELRTGLGTIAANRSSNSLALESCPFQEKLVLAPGLNSFINTDYRTSTHVTQINLGWPF